jgi:hypothetical protein
MNLRRGSIVLVVLFPALAAAQETIGPWYIVDAPVSAVEIVGGGADWSSVNVVNAQVDVNTAFSGMSVLDDGFWNGALGTTIEVTFAPGVVVNTPGDDLVMFDSRYGCNNYSFSTEYDGFVATVDKLWMAFEDTGVDRSYYYRGSGPYHVDVIAAGIDLSSLGVPPGASVDRVRFIAISDGFGSGDGIDPLGIGVACQCDSENYCSVNKNSTGSGARLHMWGSHRISDNDLRLTAFAVPHEIFLYFYGTTRTEVPFGNGYLCVSGQVVRLGPPKLAVGNAAVRQIDLSGFLPGTYNFQCWYRDPMAGGAFFNTSDAMAIPLVP